MMLKNPGMLNYRTKLLSRKFFAKLDAVCKGTRSNERYQTAAIRKKIRFLS